MILKYHDYHVIKILLVGNLRVGISEIHRTIILETTKNEDVPCPKSLYNNTQEYFYQDYQVIHLQQHRPKPIIDHLCPLLTATHR